MTEAAHIAADYIATVDSRLSALFIAQPFSRVMIAKAFAAGLKNDAMDMGATVVECALRDQQDRQEAA